MNRFAALAVLVLSVSLAPFVRADDVPAPRGWSPDAWAQQRTWEMALNESPAPERLRSWHDRLCSEPHIAGTPGDERTIDRLVDAFEQMGLEVERHDIWVYLSEPLSGGAAIVTPEAIELPIIEREIETDAFTSHPDLRFGFNAYAATGDVTGEVVYVNYGRKQDYETLAELGVDLTGKIALARYGGNYRGYKVKFAEAAGAAGVIIYTDPKDSGTGRGAPYPEGGWANDTSIQRGSIVTKPYPGDPLTPGKEATENAMRRRVSDVDLPTIPVQPIGWGAAEAILSRMTGRELPETLRDAWTGGLPITYRLEGGADLTVRVNVEQERRIVRTANVIGTLRGAVYPDEVVVAGCHHDAWGFGASDPMAGMICMLESARSFADAAAAGMPPARTLQFAAWGAEEHGIIGSTEWCEKHADRLHAQCAAYINLDMAAMGPNFRASAAPLLKSMIVDAAKVVPTYGGPDGETVYDRWSNGGTQDPRLGNLGGGSDHVGFYCHLAIPSAGIGAGGSSGTAYHSNYDTLTWYRQVVGDDYESARLVTRMTNVILARLAGAPLLPYDPLRLADDTTAHLATIAERGDAIGFPVNLMMLERTVDFFRQRVDAVWPGILDASESGDLTPAQYAQLNAALRKLERTWRVDSGLSGRPWYRSLYAATDPDSGYAAWFLPELRWAVESKSMETLRTTIPKYAGPLAQLTSTLVEMERAVR